jgi:SAM-dependent methyltransferase
LQALGAAIDDGVQTHTDPQAEAEMYLRRNNDLVAYWNRRGFLGPGSTVLDVGAGAGHIASAVARGTQGASITCIEADPNSCLHLKEKGFRSFQSLSDCNDTFDAILLVEVVEHVADPVAFLAACRARMKPAARIFLSTPCGQTSGGSIETNAYETKEHVQFFTELSLKLACQRAGLKLARFEAVNALYPRRLGVHGLLDEIKYRLLPLRDVVRGRSHLVTFLERSG